MPQHVLNYNFPKIRFCKRGHAIIGQNAFMNGGGFTCRTCMNLRQKQYARSGKIGEDKVRQVLDALREGKTLAQITGRRGGRYFGGKIIGNTRLDFFCRANPKLGARIRFLSAKNAIVQRNAAKLDRLTTAAFAHSAVVTSNGDILEVISRSRAASFASRSAR